MSLTLEMNVRGTTGIKRSWDKITQHYAKDLRPFYVEISDWWYSHQSENFAEEGRHIGDKWKPLGALTKDGPPGKYGKWKKKRHPGKPLLELSGDLQRAMTGTGKGWKKLGKDKMSLGVKNIPYWDSMNFGSPKQKIPARPMADITKDMLKDLDERIQEHMAEINREINRAAARGLAEDMRGAPGGMLR